jgi:septal ring factor EnvC (AmiA/AmiB activator)
MSDTEAARTVWPTYAMRAWLGALLAHIRRTRHDVELRIDATEKEVARLRRQHERAGSVIDELQDAIARVDERLRQVRDTEPGHRHGEPGHGHDERPHPESGTPSDPAE